jgi:DNA polymerase theta
MLFQQAARARALFKAGLRSIQAIAEATLLELVKALYGSASWAGQGMHAEFAENGKF